MSHINNFNELIFEFATTPKMHFVSSKQKLYLLHLQIEQDRGVSFLSE